MHILIAEAHETACEGTLDDVIEEVRAGDGARTRRSACLEGRYLQNHRLLDTSSLDRLVGRCFLVLTLARQKFSLASFAPSGKSFHVVLQ